MTNNVLYNNKTGVTIDTFDAVMGHNADNITITGNSILGVPDNGFGINIHADDPGTKSIKKVTISKNLIVSNQFGSGTCSGISVTADAPATTTVTVTTSSNTFLGIQPINRIFNSNGFASVTLKSNESLP